MHNNLIKNIVTIATTDINLPSQLGNKLDTIRIPTFIDFSALELGSATVFSFLAFLGTVATVALVAFWIYRIVRLGIEGIQSEGKPEKIQELIKKLQSILLGVFMTFLFPLILSIIGIFAGVGTIFNWPKMFRACPASSTYEYYFQAYLNIGGVDTSSGTGNAAQDTTGATAVEAADIECGYTD